MSKPFLATALFAAAVVPVLSSDPTEPTAVSVAQEEEGEISKLLRQMYEDDQAVRASWSSRRDLTPEEMGKIHQEDERRREEVLAIIADGLLETGDDYFHAAMILQHGGEPEDYLMSHVLASVGGFEGNKSSRWLAAASLDRYLQSIDRPQVFGTQYSTHRMTGKWTQEPIEGELLTDQVRQCYGVPALSVAAERLVEMNR